MIDDVYLLRKSDGNEIHEFILSLQEFFFFFFFSISTSSLFEPQGGNKRHLFNWNSIIQLSELKGLVEEGSITCL